MGRVGCNTGRILDLKVCACLPALRCGHAFARGYLRDIEISRQYTPLGETPVRMLVLHTPLYF